MSERQTWQWTTLAAALVAAAGCNRTESRPAAATAAEQPGDQASSQPPRVQSDDWLTTQVQARFFDDQVVRGHDIDVSADGGVVTLSGTVRTEEARAQAGTLAGQVDGVARVDNRLTVGAGRAAADRQAAGDPDGSAGARTDAAPSTLGARIDAGWTTTKIQAQYFASPDVKGRSIDVTTDAAGTVTLRGRVDSEPARAEAIRIAKATEGVRRVADELRVTAGDRPAESASGTRTAAAAVDDGWTTAKIQSKFFLDPDVKSRDVDVSTTDGVVTLSGRIDSPAARRQAVDLARTTDGVQRVEDRMTLHAVTALAGDPTGPGRALDTPTDPSDVMAPPDGWITTTVQSKFFLSDELRGEDIDVATARGVVTLRGEVGSAERRDTAQSIAQGTRGVRRVANQLTIGGTDE